MAEVEYRVSKDGKTVSAGGRTYSVSAFINQHPLGAFGIPLKEYDLTPNAKGTASGPARQRLVTPKVDSSPEKAKSRAEKKATARSVKSMNKAGIGKKLLERNQGGITSGTGKRNVNPTYRNMQSARGAGLGGLLGKLPK